MRRSLIPLASVMWFVTTFVFASEAEMPSHDVTEHARAVPKFRYYSGTAARHSGRVLRWYYNPTNEPPALAGRMVSILRTAAAQWSRRCAIQFEYMGGTTQPAPSYDLANVFGWGPTPGGSIAMAWVRSENGARIDDADIMFNPSHVQSESLAYTAAVHEIGHALGLAHSDKESAVMSGPPYSSYTYRAEPSLDDVEGCQALYNNPYCSTPKPADEFMVEAGGCPAGMEGGMRYRRSHYCAEGTWHANPWERETRACAARQSTASAPTATLKEYVRESTGQYFITAQKLEQQALESGAMPGWMATGVAWPVWESAAPGLVATCRFHGDASVDANGKRKGPDAHFYTADAAECAHVQSAFPVWRLETTEAFRVALPQQGQCAAGLRPVTRFFRPTGEPVHRYVSDGSLAMMMLARGWIAEGVVFCLPT